MRLDALKQYAKLRQQLLDEKSQLEARLNEINQVIGSEATSAPISSSSATKAPAVSRARRGRRPKGDNALTMREAVLQALSKGPLARKELVKAVEDIGYVFTTKHPLNSIGSILYAKNTPVKSKGGKFYLPGNAAPSAGGNNGSSETSTAPTRRKRRRMSAEARARIAAAQRARWAKVRGSK